MMMMIISLLFFFFLSFYFFFFSSYFLIFFFFFFTFLFYCNHRTFVWFGRLNNVLKYTGCKAIANIPSLRRVQTTQSQGVYYSWLNYLSNPSANKWQCSGGTVCDGCAKLGESCVYRQHYRALNGYSIKM